MSSSSDNVITCRLCGQNHRSIALAAGETARCIRCGGRLASAPCFGPHTRLAFAFAGLAFAVPAALLPFITVEKFRNVRTGNFFDSVFQLHAHGMPFLAIWVLICAGLAPFLLIAALIVGHRHPLHARSLGHALAHWTMPEVYVLAVFVSLMRLGSIVNVEINTGFWSYTAMSFALLAAWRAFRLQPPSRPSP